MIEISPFDEALTEARIVLTTAQRETLPWWVVQLVEELKEWETKNNNK